MSADATWNAFAIDGRPSVDLEGLSWMYRVARALMVGHKLGVFGELLAGPSTPAAVAAACGILPDPAERLLIVLAATGLLYRQPDGRFRLTADGRAAFDPASPRYYGDGLAHSTQVWDRWHRLEDSLKGVPGGSGPPAGDGFRIFVSAMHDYGIRGRAQWLAGMVDLAGRKKLLDLGGGPGTYSIALCQGFPELRATIWDQEATRPVAAANVARFGLSERIDFVAGDYDRDEFGRDYDVALLSNVLHGTGRGNEERLARTFRALAPGGLLLVQDFLLDDDRNGPLEAAMFNLHVGAYAVGELLAVIGAAGFEDAALRGRGAHGNGLVVAKRSARS